MNSALWFSHQPQGVVVITGNDKHSLNAKQCHTHQKIQPLNSYLAQIHILYYLFNRKAGLKSKLPRQSSSSSHNSSPQCFILASLHLSVSVQCEKESLFYSDRHIWHPSWQLLSSRSVTTWSTFSKSLQQTSGWTALNSLTTLNAKSRKVNSACTSLRCDWFTSHLKSAGRYYTVGIKFVHPCNETRFLGSKKGDSDILTLIHTNPNSIKFEHWLICK